MILFRNMILLIVFIYLYIYIYLDTWVLVTHRTLNRMTFAI